MRTLSEMHPELAIFLENMSYTDLKSAPTDKNLETVIADLFSFRPGWLRGFYALRGLLARLLGLHHDSEITAGPVRPEEISMQVGGKARFFEVVSVRENIWWVGRASDRHLTAWITVVREPQTGGPARIHLATSVRHHHWTGPLYFNLIKPFHHLIAGAMLQQAARKS